MNCRYVENKLLEMDYLPDNYEELSENIGAHIRNCSNCHRVYDQMLRARKTLYEMGTIHLPSHILNHYLDDLNLKIELLEKKPSKVKMTLKPQSLFQKWHVFRPAFIGLLIVFIAVGIWWFGICPNSDSGKDMLTTDSLGYYLESFNEESLQNPVAMVKGLEYEWVYYGNTEDEK